MTFRLFQVDAFTEELFRGNPAAVCPLERWLPDETLQKIAMENNLSETAFYVREGGRFHIRWFTPAVEVELCGHATLASGYVVFEVEGFPGPVVEFDSRSGPLRVRRDGGRLTLDFPADEAKPAEPPVGLFEALGARPLEVYRGRTDYLLVFGSESEVEAIKPDFGRLAEVEARGVIVTARGNQADFVSRFFAPRVGVPEDPVTGSAHATLTPFWARRLGKSELEAVQLSRRGGWLWVKAAGDRVEISGQARLYLSGEIVLP
ncbi:MAG: PhzF family phenazine biosynthesis protein [Candidatus Aminicenantes bacterium]|nr:PhzF family phenazine biosynthesis protein [Candidatus Aminicenantes bacterium]